jgi:vitamin B12 transporter
MTRGRWWGILAGVGLAVVGAGAEERTEVKRAEPVVVTGTLLEERLEQLGASVTIVPEEMFRVHEWRESAQPLRTVPGVDVQTSGSPGKLTTVRIRGANPSQIQVLIDGVRVKSTTSGDFDFSTVTLDAVERIEVLRGPQSTLYGADAIGGVINIITRRGAGAPAGFVDVEGGNYGTVRARAGGSGAAGPWSFSLGASVLGAEGQFDNDAQRQGSVNARVAHALPGGGELSLVGRYAANRVEIPFRTVYPDFDENRHQEDRLSLLSLEWRQPWTAAYRHVLRLSAVDERLRFVDQPEPGQPFGFTSDIGSARREATWLHSLDLGRVDTITVGLEYRREEGRNEGAFSRTVDSWALVAQNELRLFESLFVTGGVRYDDSEAYGGKATGRVAASYVMRSTDTRLKASWAQGYRAPTFNDLYFPAFPPCPSFGNPDLRPEESDSWDAGIEQHLWGRRVRLGATVFRNDFRDLIQAAVVDPVNFCFQAQNVGKARTRGVEVEASATPVDGLTLGLAYTYTDAEDLTTGEPLRRVPKNRLAVTGSWEPLPGLVLFGELLVSGSQFEGTGLPDNPGYAVVNAGASYRLPWRWGPLSDITLHVRIDNLFNESYSPVSGFPALGTHVVGGLRATFN